MEAITAVACINLVGLRYWTCFLTAVLLYVGLSASSRGQESLKYSSIYLTGVSVGLTVAGPCACKNTCVSRVCHWVGKKDLELVDRECCRARGKPKPASSVGVNELPYGCLMSRLSLKSL